VAVAEVNDTFKKRTLARAEPFRWKGALNEEVEGLLYYPHGYESGKKYPLVVVIHGGPFAADVDSWDETWHTAPNLLAQRGAFVFRRTTTAARTTVSSSPRRLPAANTTTCR